MKKKHLSKEKVEQMAWLAHIELSDKEKSLFTDQFNEILEYFKKIDEADTKGVEPTYNVLDLKNVSRKDETTHSLSTEAALKNAPKKEKKFFKAPRIV